MRVQRPKRRRLPPCTPGAPRERAPPAGAYWPWPAVPPPLSAVVRPAPASLVRWAHAASSRMAYSFGCKCACNRPPHRYPPATRFHWTMCALCAIEKTLAGREMRCAVPRPPFFKRAVAGCDCGHLLAVVCVKISTAPFAEDEKKENTLGISCCLRPSTPLLPNRTAPIDVADTVDRDNDVSPAKVG